MEARGSCTQLKIQPLGTQGAYSFETGCHRWEGWFTEREWIDLQDCRADLLGCTRPRPWDLPDRLQTLTAIRRFGEALARGMPPDLRTHLESAEGVLLLEETEGVPWDLSFWGDAHLWMRLEVSRSGAEPCSGDEAGRPKALLLFDPDHHFEDGGLEASLEASFQVDARRGARVDSGSFFSAFERDGCGLLSLTAAVDHQHRLLLADGWVDPRQAAWVNAGGCPRVIHLHLVPDVSGFEHDLPSALDTWWSVFREKGCECLLGLRWDCDPCVSGELLSACFSRLSRWPLGRALRQARLDRLNAPDPYGIAHAYCLFGNPALSAGAILPRRRYQARTTVDRPMAAQYRLVVQEGPEAGRAIPIFPSLLEGKEAGLYIGRPGPLWCDIEFEDARLENRTAALVVESGTLKLRNLTAAPDRVRVNGLPVAREIPLTAGDRLELGGTLLEVRAPAGQSPSITSQASRVYRVEVCRGLATDQGRIAHLRDEALVVGRRPDCGLTLQDPSVSRQHLVVLPRDGGYVAEPVAGRQVIINGLRLEEPRALRHGDVIQLSDATVLRFADTQRERK